MERFLARRQYKQFVLDDSLSSESESSHDDEDVETSSRLRSPTTRNRRRHDENRVKQSNNIVFRSLQRGVYNPKYAASFVQTPQSQTALSVSPSLIYSQAEKSQM